MNNLLTGFCVLIIFVVLLTMFLWVTGEFEPKPKQKRRHWPSRTSNYSVKRWRS